VPALALAALHVPAAVAAPTTPGPTVALATAFAGWTRPDRLGEVTATVRSGTAGRGVLELTAGKVQYRVPVALEPGVPLRVHATLPTRAPVDAVLALDGAAPARAEAVWRQSETPLLAVVLTGDASAVTLAGFNAVAVAPLDLPRDASAYAGVDGLVIDGGALRALEPRQLAALLGHLGTCGRVAAVDVSPDVVRGLQAAAGCGGRALATGDGAADALRSLQASAPDPSAAGVAAADLGALARAEPTTWPRAAMLLAVGMAAVVVTLTLTSSLVVLVAASAAVAAITGVVLQSSEPRARLVVWSEAVPGAAVARFDAWLQASSSSRRTLTADVPAGLGTPIACRPQQAVRLGTASNGERVTTASFDGARLFGTAELCFRGTFPVQRNFEVVPVAPRQLRVVNRGPLAAPAGRLLTDGKVLDLPPLPAGATVLVNAAEAVAPSDAAARAAAARTPFDGHGLLWPLRLDAVEDAPADAVAWLFVAVPGPA
jgi:hypothetical protein